MSEKRKVYCLEDDQTTPSRLVYDSFEDLKDHIESMIDSLDSDETYEVKISISFMTEEEIINLPEFDY